jgi:hypothetical protein
VPPDALGVARGHQVNKLGWATKRRKEIAAESKPAKRPAHAQLKRQNKSRPAKRKR